ncbi:MAG TPA: allantoate amidohydrolase [Candidatus Dormibacteraeota bacterium]|nr:allantoate amidohydrolase [Candidatus Dormibacteraeota bacterium]
MIKADAETVMQWCELLAACSEEPNQLTRPFATEAMHRAHAHVGRWMSDAGMTVRRDNIGNLRGRYEAVAPDRPTLLLGSHLDSVRGAGKYDGPLGVAVAIAAVQRLQNSKARLPFAIEVIGFADEEGLRFGSTYLGSRAVAGAFEPNDLGRTDAAGVSMAEAIRAFGGDPLRIADDRWGEGELLGYCEVHIEQGPVLEARGLPVGVVSAIAGQNRYTITFKGEAGHAGTVPMNQRRDALVAASELVVAAEAEARSRDGLMATVGRLEVHPGAANVIPGEVELSLDVRHADDAIRVDASRRILACAQDIAAKRNIAVAAHMLSENAAVPCAPRLVSLLSRVVEDAGQPVVRLPSGAGHDGVPMATLTDIGMLFVRCKGGVSHNPAEAVTAEDVAVAMDVVGRFLKLVAKQA